MEDLKGRYLTFILENEEFGIGINRIVEIIGMMPMSEIPKSLPYVKGIINLRGRIIPVIDLRLRLDKLEKTYDERTSIIVVELTQEEGQKQVGFIVDTVNEVAIIQDVDPPLVENINERILLGIGKIESRVIMLLDIDHILTEKETEYYAEQNKAEEN